MNMATFYVKLVTKEHEKSFFIIEDKMGGESMEDNKIIDLYWSRSEQAIKETDTKYGKYCFTIAHNILHDRSDSEECVNDTYMHAWNYIPPGRPNKLSVFLGKICRNLSLDKLKFRTAEKRGKGEPYLILDELKECIPCNDNTESIAEDMVIVEVLNRFLTGLDVEKRKIFMRRYWYMNSIGEISKAMSLSESNVKMSLLRMRNQLKELLQEGGVHL